MQEESCGKGGKTIAEMVNLMERWSSRGTQRREREERREFGTKIMNAMVHRNEVDN